MKFKAQINVMPLKELLDPQGKTVGKNMGNVGISGIENVRIGKRIELLIDANDQAEAEGKVETACKKLLTNVVMESYAFEVVPA
ncbi:MAG: phosphoribosylformylglycinamidine synthase subunit PurS [Saprospiraceae bacterium]